MFRAATAGLGVLAATLALFGQVNKPDDKARPPEEQAAGAGDATPSTTLLDLRETLDRARSTGTSPVDGDPGLREPADEFAKKVVDTIARSEKDVEDDWQRFAQSIESQNKNFDLFKEAEFIDALKKVVGDLLVQSKEMRDRYVSLGNNNEKLKDALRKAPAYLREAAREYEAYAKATKTPEVAESYMALSSLWASRAAIIEKRGTDVAKYYDPGMVEFLEEWHQFFRRLGPMLDSYNSRVFGSEQHQQFNERMKGYLKKLDQLHNSLKEMRQKAMEQAENDEVRSVLVAEKRAEEERHLVELRVEAERLRAAREEARRDYLQRSAVLLSYRGEPEQALARYREKAKGRGVELLSGQSIPVVRLRPGSDGIEQVASLSLGGPPNGPVTASLPPGADVGDYLLPPDVDHPSSVVDEALRAALAAIRSGNEKTKAVVFAQRAEIERIAKLRRASAAVLEEHAHFVWRDASRPLENDHWNEIMFIDSKALPISHLGYIVYYYGEDDLLNGIVKHKGSVVVTGHSRLGGMVMLGKASMPIGQITNVGSRIAVVTPTGLAQVEELGRLSRAAVAKRPQGLL